MPLFIIFFLKFSLKFYFNFLVSYSSPFFINSNPNFHFSLQPLFSLNPKLMFLLIS
jgi:hypothetical protein